MTYHLSIPLNEREPLTYSTWKELLQQAQEAKVPYFLVAVCTSYDAAKGARVQKIYDAVYFDRYREDRDPVTRLPIVQVEYCHFKISNFHIRKKQLILARYKPEFVKFTIPADFQGTAISFEANNYHARAEFQSKRAECQYVFGEYLLYRAYSSSSSRQDLQEALRWLSCAAEGGYLPAEVRISQTYEDCFPKKLAKMKQCCG